MPTDLPRALFLSGSPSDWPLGDLQLVVQRADVAGVETLVVPDGIAPRDGGEAWPDALILMGWFAPQTRSIVLLGAVSSLGHQPYNLARRLASLDLISRGRAGWVIADGDADAEFAAFSGANRLAGVDLAARQREFETVVDGLWDSWDADALLFDKEGGRFFEPSRLHSLNHQGEHFSVRGPLNVMRWQKGRPRMTRFDKLGPVTTVASANAALALLGGGA
ncbi:LLM class flavin-dependent oxidoreductase [Tianweitania sediminis]|uniref:LLM class flavin-dependent oxidoreductase n=1 Tax=Tianweitania sediminis TaxID=1502156 RepID=A0A8J7REP9_9HYPH|nr:LLM class flavin-dependent oxidoreductase [Tianweitania sediminis]MBP0437126.1 LLM class flavin-dependent oxidoreductase [Tianweitania sediminis]